MARYGLGLALLCSVFSCGCALAGEGADSRLASPAATPALPVFPAPIAAAAPPPPACCVIPAGTVIIVELTEALSARTSSSGDHFGLRLAEPIMIDGAVVIPAGVLGQGEVIDAKPAGIGGRPARLVLAARYLQSGPLKLGLQSFKLGGAGGKDNSGLAVGAVIAVGILGALVEGGGVEYPAGTRATAKIAASVAAAPSGAPATIPSVPNP